MSSMSVFVCNYWSYFSNKRFSAFLWRLVYAHFFHLVLWCTITSIGLDVEVEFKKKLKTGLA